MPRREEWMATFRNRSIHATSSPKSRDVWQEPKDSRTMLRILLKERANSLDRASLLERVEGDQELLAEMINLFLEDAPRLLAAMRDALATGRHAGAGTVRAFHERRGGQSLGSCYGERCLATLNKTRKTETRNPRKRVLRYSKAPSNDCFQCWRICARGFRNEDSDRRRRASFAPDASGPSDEVGL